MKEPLWHFTKREVQQDLKSPIVRICILAVGAIVGLAGPFSTIEVMRLVPRLAYWVVVVALSYVSGAVVSTLTLEAAERRALPMWLSVGMAAVLCAVVVTVGVFGLNALIFGADQFDFADLQMLFVNVLAVSAIVIGAFTAVEHFHNEPATSADLPQDGPPALLDRLPFEKRGPLVSLSVEDHYVSITTTKGTEMVLMRLSDAIRETAPVEGMQVHRSHWVARSQIASVHRDGAKALLHLSDGREIPVSRTYVPALKEAGLLSDPLKTRSTD